MSCAVCRGPLSHIETEWDSSVKSLLAPRGLHLARRVKRGERETMRDTVSRGR